MLDLARGRTRTDIELAQVVYHRPRGTVDRGRASEYIYRSGIAYLHRPARRRWVEYAGRFGLFDFLRFIQADARRLGLAEAHLGGTATTRITGIVSLRRAMVRVLGALHADDRRYLDRLAGLGSERIPFTVWLDARQRIRQIRFEADLLYFGGNEGTRASAVTRLVRFDGDISIEGPPPQQIVRRLTGPRRR
ncbi:MAG: hypothetical protein QOE69_2309 [Thermoleophilaceae bacterium]|jgi:hypothetical protein|nr:hypothetical protein [Thermoleophilaceae bacterium]